MKFSKRSSPLLFAAAVALRSVCACGDAPATTSTPGGSPGTVSTERSCVFESRRVLHCGGPSVIKDWSKGCQPLPCPYYIDHNITFPGNGGTCTDAEEQRNVVDFAGSCDAWTMRGEPLDRPAPIYCGHSLFYNEFSYQTGCGACLKGHCPSEYQACYPFIVNGGAMSSRCDSLVRCLRDCTAGDTAVGDACLQQYADAVDAANAFGTCLSNNCSNECN